MKHLLRITLLLVVMIVAAMVATLAPVDTETYESSNYLQQSLANIRQQDTTEALPGLLNVGWAKVNLSPGFSTPMATSEARKGKHYRIIEDSIWVRAFVFENGHNKVAWLTADLLIIPQEVTEKLDQLLPGIGFTNENVFMTATHTHSSIGGWQQGYVGSRFAGKYNPQVVDHIAQTIVTAIKQADTDLQPATIGYKEDVAAEQLYNRLVGAKGTTDGYVRTVRIKRADGSSGAIVTFAGHATCLADTFMHIHRDYPGYLTDYIEKNTRVDFAAFAAGAMGSMGPAFEHLGTFGQAQQLASDLHYKILTGWNAIELIDTVALEVHQVPIALRQPNMRLTNNIRIRPWVFKLLFGESTVYLDYLRIGNIVFLGTPADFSGELVAPLTSNARAKGRHLIITSFNGGYCGYITNDKWYEMESYETRTMNWFGPGTGAYFSTLMDTMIAVY